MKDNSSWELSDSLTLSDCKDGFWLYDTTRGMNIAMKAKSADEAFVEALTYYQGRLQEVETALKTLRAKIDQFLILFESDDD